jgi:hypothetical protein
VKPQYEPKTRGQFYGYLIEECGELMAAAGKTLRWGEDSFNPEIPAEQREDNIDWLLRELKDLKGAIRRFEKWARENSDDYAMAEAQEGL